MQVTPSTAAEEPPAGGPTGSTVIASADTGPATDPRTATTDDRGRADERPEPGLGAPSVRPITG